MKLKLFRKFWLFLKIVWLYDQSGGRISFSIACKLLKLCTGSKLNDQTNGRGIVSK